MEPFDLITSIKMNYYRLSSGGNDRQFEKRKTNEARERRVRERKFVENRWNKGNKREIVCAIRSEFSKSEREQIIGRERFTQNISNLDPSPSLSKISFSCTRHRRSNFRFRRVTRLIYSRFRGTFLVESAGKFFKILRVNCVNIGMERGKKISA